MSLKKTRFHSALLWPTILLGSLCLMLSLYAITSDENMELNARVLPIHLRNEIRWDVLNEDEITAGATLPAHTNVIIYLPEDMTRITRKNFFGRRGKLVRYWGYCFPEDYDRDAALRRTGFPGTLFLSEAERDYRRADLQRQRRDRFSIPGDLTKDNLNERRNTRGRIRHQLEIFQPGSSCFVMSFEALAVGVDEDRDGLNSGLELVWHSDPAVQDTDGDGIIDGLEVFGLGTYPNKRDSDGDHLLDGIEDANQNGRWDPGETNPTDIDTDRDGLCDGYCIHNRTGQLRGEDKNLNGIVDDGEYNPLLVDSDGDDVLDKEEFFQCILANGANC